MYKVIASGYHLWQGFSNVFVLRPHFGNLFFYAVPLTDSLEPEMLMIRGNVPLQISKSKYIFCLWRNHINAHNPRK